MDLYVAMALRDLDNTQPSRLLGVFEDPDQAEQAVVGFLDPNANDRPRVIEEVRNCSGLNPDAARDWGKVHAGTRRADVVVVVYQTEIDP